MSTKFTPGPWDVGISADNGIHCVDVTCADGGVIEIAEVWGTNEDKVETIESKANAHLIAAAPDLYEALAKLERQCVELYRAAAPGGNYGANAVGSNLNESAFADNDPAVQDARAALAKARGEA